MRLAVFRRLFCCCCLVWNCTEQNGISIHPYWLAFYCYAGPICFVALSGKMPKIERIAFIKMSFLVCSIASKNCCVNFNENFILTPFCVGCGRGCKCMCVCVCLCVRAPPRKRSIQSYPKIFDQYKQTKIIIIRQLDGNTVIIRIEHEHETVWKLTCIQIE